MAGAAADSSIVTVSDLSVCLSLQREKVTSLREYTIRRLKGSAVPPEQFWPLRDISFAITRGEVFGIIGRNGAGKSTLLKVIAGILRPWTGQVRVRGKIAPLLELGAGFDPELTGEENVVLYGSILGLSTPTIRERMQSILEFAELEDFADVPMKNYSTGMSARLGFAVAMAVDAQLLLIDEVFAVGDAFFEEKCIKRIDQFRANQGTVIVVSHDTSLIKQQCHRALFIEHGRCKVVGAPDRVVAEYLASEG